ncbi:hypothetical protein L1887_48092 [Cichorium endivia]|nr:hypothetical protein L1887_48092 [Cichorium endivia]
MPGAARIPDTAVTPSPSVDKKDVGVEAQRHESRTIQVDGATTPPTTSAILSSARNATSVVVHGLRAKTAEEFQDYLEAAVAAKIVTTEPGFKPGVRHVRLHPRLVKPGSQTQVTDGETDETDEDDSRDRVKVNLFSLGKNQDRSAGTSDSDEPRPAHELDAIRKETSQVLASLQRSTSSEGATASGPVPADDATRFRPLLDSLARDSPPRHHPASPRPSSRANSESASPLPRASAPFISRSDRPDSPTTLQQAMQKRLVVIADADCQHHPAHELSHRPLGLPCSPCQLGAPGSHNTTTTPWHESSLEHSFPIRTAKPIGTITACRH